MSLSEEFTTKMVLKAGYDHRDETDEGRLRGCHGADLELVLIGPLGAITTTISTGWMHRPVEGRVIWGQKQRRRNKPGLDTLSWDSYPSGAVVASHWRKPVSEYDTASGYDCPWLDGAQCFGSGGYLIADEVLDILISQGDDAAYERMAAIYADWSTWSPSE